MLNRRTFLLGGAAAGALVVGWTLLRPEDRLDADLPPPASTGDTRLNGWVVIGADNRVTVVMSKAEMGQGVHTGAAMLLAEELDADWAQVRVEQSPVAPLYVNQENLPRSLPLRPDDEGALAHISEYLARHSARLLGSMVTGGSTSIVDLWQPMREAGASARAMLCSAAARRWDVPQEQCEARSGRVFHAASGRSASFGELAADAGGLPHPRHPTLKDPKTFALIGRRLGRIEARSKLDGTARFGIDALPENLRYASVLMCPTLGGTVRKFDANKVMHKIGVKGFYPVDAYHGGTGGVAAIAENPFIAMRALCELPVEWDHGPAAGLNTDDVRAALVRALESSDGGHTFYRTGDAEAALKRGKMLEMRYEVPYLAHGALEPVNCTVQVDGRKAQVWVSTQVPMAARKAVAHLLGLAADDVQIHQQLLGGAFGRRLEIDYIVQAAAIARHASPSPVQTIWSRPQDMTHDFYRPACVAVCRGALDADGRLVAWQSVSASQSIAEQALPRAFGKPRFLTRLLPDATMAEGAFDQPYACPNMLVQHHRVELPVPVGYWRSVGHSHQAFFVECFLDEMAAAAGKDPLAFRLALLSQPAHQRHVRVLETLRERAAWRGPPQWKDRDGVAFARGMAMHESFGSVVAQVAEVAEVRNRAGAGENGFRVTRVICVVDCGRAINPSLVEQQMESGIVFGLSAALQQAITLRNGQVQQHYFTDFPLVDMQTCPTIETYVMDSDAAPEGVGETATPPVAPAVANALFALTGRRHRRLPLQPPPALPEGNDPWCQSVSTARP